MKVEEAKEWSVGSVNQMDLEKADIPLIKKPLSTRTILVRSTLLGLSLITIYYFLTMYDAKIDFLSGLSTTVHHFGLMFLQPWFHHFTFFEAFNAVMVTLGLAFLTTLLGAIIALILGLWTALNLSHPAVSNIIRGIAAFIRSVPTVLWVLIFAVAAGLGSEAAVIGMTFHTVGYLVKAYAESFEELDDGILEALKASGANWWQMIFQAVIPSSLTYLLSWTFLRFEINFSVAVAMGAAAGAGGIGFDLFMASGHYFDIREVGTITYFILIFAFILESISTRMKGKIKGIV